MSDPSHTAAGSDKPAGDRPPSTVAPSKLWGAETIARYLGVSPDSVRAWAREPGTPIYQPRGRTYFADRRELDAWLRNKPAA